MTMMKIMQTIIMMMIISIKSLHAHIISAENAAQVITENNVNACLQGKETHKSSLYPDME